MNHYTHAEFDDIPAADVTIAYTYAIQPAEPDVGVMRAYADVWARVERWQIGDLTLDRKQMIAAFGAGVVERFEDQQADLIADKMKEGELT